MVLETPKPLSRIAKFGIAILAIFLMLVVTVAFAMLQDSSFHRKKQDSSFGPKSD